MSAEPTGRKHLRIGELSRRVGVSTDVIRAWERRYGLFAPDRTPGGFRLYGAEDELAARQMLEHLASGLSSSEAAGLTRATEGGPDAFLGNGVPASAGAPAEVFATEAAADAAAESRRDAPMALHLELASALDEFDEAGAHAALDRLLAGFALETVLRDAILPYLRHLGERWARGEASIAQEHFASALLRGRLLGLARGWGVGLGPLALLACLPGEQHDLGLVCFGLALRTHGWRVNFLGADTPMSAVTGPVGLLRPELVVLYAGRAEQVTGAELELRALASEITLAIAGDGADATTAERIGAIYLEDDPVTAARRAAKPRRGPAT